MALGTNRKIINLIDCRELISDYNYYTSIVAFAGGAYGRYTVIFGIEFFFFSITRRQ